MDCSKFEYSNHAVAQMFRRQISPDEVELAIGEGEIVKEYPEDKPFPSFLKLFFSTRLRPIHVVVSQDVSTGICYIITATSQTQAFGSLISKIKFDSLCTFAQFAKQGNCCPESQPSH
jgi:hypothetical protein